MSDQDRLPWLEPIEEEEARGPSTAKLIGAVLIGLVALAVIAGGAYWLLRQDTVSGWGGIIAAPDGPYKIKPADPGGLEAEAEAGGGSAFAASVGEQPEGRLAIGPATGREPRPSAEPAAPKSEPADRAQPAAGVATIQLGAFSSQAGARRAWEALSGRFVYLEPLGHAIIPVEAEGRTLYRLRATGSGAAGICRRLRIAGEECEPID